jgi:dipeptidyl-peptidase 4
MENNVPKQETAADTEPVRLTLQAIYTDKIFETVQLRQPQWLQDSNRFSYIASFPETEVSTIWLYDIRSGTPIPIIPAVTLQLPTPEPKSEGTPPVKPSFIPIPGYQWSPDETHLLLAHLPHRRASQGDKMLYVYTLADGELRKVAESEHELRNAKWSPDGKAIGYVRQDNIYLLDLATGIETQLTTTSSPTIYNGRFGWVYEEELALADGWAFSPDGKSLAYYQIDETPVPQIDLPDYDDLHMKPVPMRYPKAGDPNPIVKIGVIALTEAIQNPKSKIQNLETLWLDLGPDPDIYLSRLQWTPTGELLLHRIPRLQNKIEVLRADLATGATTVILAEEEATWVDIRGDLTFIKETGEFLWPSCRDGYRHLYLYAADGQLVRQLTQGAWEVETIVGVDAVGRSLTFTAANPNPLERQLFRVSLDGGEPVQLTEEKGTHTAVLSPNGNHYLHTHSNIVTPPQTRLRRADGATVATLLENPQPKLKNVPLAKWEFTTFETGDGVTLNVAILRPRDFDSNRRYPVVMHTYGGPGSQVVRDNYGSGRGLEQFFAGHGVITVQVDGRGSGMRGRDFEKVTYLKLGHYEVQDQIQGAQWLRGLPYVDAERIGIWGWSYGGYMASLCILRGADVFRSAAAVAPVTDWALYDSIYTERYMRRPQDNAEGYATTAALTDVARLKGDFLLVHGLADDNVHFQNAARLAQALQKENRPFRAMFYPGKHHGLEGVAPHWAELISTFFLETLRVTGA